MNWEKRIVRNGHVNYECRCGNLHLVLSTPCAEQVWIVTLAYNGQTLDKDAFCLRNGSVHNMIVPESIEDLEQAKTTAYAKMHRYLQNHIDYWCALRAMLEEMKDGGV